MKLTEKYEVLFMERAANEGLKDFQGYRKKVFAKIKRMRNPSKKDIEKAFEQDKLSYDNYTSMLFVAMVLAPIVNYIAQPTQVKQSPDPRARSMIREMRLAYQVNDNTDSPTPKRPSLSDPNAFIAQTFQTVHDVRHKPGAQFMKGSFTKFLSHIDKQRDTIIESATSRLQKHSSMFKQTLAGDVYRKYLKHIDLGATKNDAIELSLNENEAQSDRRLRKYLENEAHEDFEKAKSEDAMARGFMFKYWRTQRDARVRDSHADVDGEIVKQDDYFILEGGRALYPGDSGLPPEERINCRCTIEYSFIERGTLKT